MSLSCFLTLFFILYCSTELHVTLLLPNSVIPSSIQTVLCMHSLAQSSEFWTKFQLTLSSCQAVSISTLVKPYRRLAYVEILFMVGRGKKAYNEFSRFMDIKHNWIYIWFSKTFTLSVTICMLQFKVFTLHSTEICYTCAHWHPTHTPQKSNMFTYKNADTKTKNMRKKRREENKANNNKSPFE